MKRGLILALALGCSVSAFALPEASLALSTIFSEDLSTSLSLDNALGAFQTADPFMGFGWEVVVDQVGFGGSYLAKFLEDDSSTWWLDWYAEGLYVSYHIFGAAARFDPFVRTGVGCAGRVFVRGPGPADEVLAISLFPFVGAGLDLRLGGGLNLGVVADYLPKTSAIPATTIPAYDLGQYQVSALVGFKLGGGFRR